MHPPSPLIQSSPRYYPTASGQKQPTNTVNNSPVDQQAIDQSVLVQLHKVITEANILGAAVKHLRALYLLSGTQFLDCIHYRLIENPTADNEEYTSGGRLFMKWWVKDDMFGTLNIDEGDMQSNIDFDSYAHSKEFEKLCYRLYYKVLPDKISAKDKLEATSKYALEAIQFKPTSENLTSLAQSADWDLFWQEVAKDKGYDKEKLNKLKAFCLDALSFAIASTIKNGAQRVVNEIQKTINDRPVNNINPHVMFLKVVFFEAESNSVQNDEPCYVIEQNFVNYLRELKGEIRNDVSILTSEQLEKMFSTNIREELETTDFQRVIKSLDQNKIEQDLKYILIEAFNVGQDTQKLFMGSSKGTAFEAFWNEFANTNKDKLTQIEVRVLKDLYLDRLCTAMASFILDIENNKPQQNESRKSPQKENKSLLKGIGSAVNLAISKVGVREEKEGRALNRSKTAPSSTSSPYINTNSSNSSDSSSTSSSTVSISDSSTQMHHAKDNKLKFSPRSFKAAITSSGSKSEKSESPTSSPNTKEQSASTPIQRTHPLNISSSDRERKNSGNKHDSHSRTPESRNQSPHGETKSNKPSSNLSTTD